MLVLKLNRNTKKKWQKKINPDCHHLSDDLQKLWEVHFHNAITSVQISFGSVLARALVYVGSIAGTVTIIGLDRFACLWTNQNERLLCFFWKI